MRHPGWHPTLGAYPRTLSEVSKDSARRWPQPSWGGASARPPPQRSEATIWSEYRVLERLRSLPIDVIFLPVPALPKGRNWSQEERKSWRWNLERAAGQRLRRLVRRGSGGVRLPWLRGLLGHRGGLAGAGVRHLGAQLRLTPAGMASLGWVIETAGES